MKLKDKNSHRAVHALHRASVEYPNAWSQFDAFRAAKGAPDFHDWPDWCYLPLAAGISVVTNGVGYSALQALVEDYAKKPGGAPTGPGALVALGSWRMTKGIYRIDPALYESLVKTPICEKLPVDVFFQMPQWCVYIETPGEVYGEMNCHGVFVHLEYDVNDGHRELRFVLNTDNHLVSIPVHIDQLTLTDALNSAFDVADQNAIKFGLASAPRQVFEPNAKELVQRLMNLVVYVCSQNDFVDRSLKSPQAQPQNPKIKKTRRQGWKLFAARGCTEWDVGIRVGAALRKAYELEQMGESSAPTGRKQRPHVRDAHWHTFLSGKRLRDDGTAIPASERKRHIKWVPPIAINVDDVDGLPAVIRRQF